MKAARIHIAAAINEARQQALRDAAEIARNFPAISHGHLCVTPAATAAQVSAEIAVAIEAEIDKPTNWKRTER